MKHKHGIVGDFFDVIGSDYSDIITPRSAVVNGSLSGMSLRLIDKINSLVDAPPHTPRRDALLQCLMDIDRDYGNAAFALPAKTIEILNAKYRDQFNWVNDELGIAIDLRAFPVERDKKRA